MKIYPMRQWNMGEVVAENAALHGDRTFIQFEDRRYSYRDLDDLSNRTANGLAQLHSLQYTSGTTGPSKGNLSTHAHAFSCGYAMSDRGMMAARGPNDPPEKWASGGKPCEHVELVIADDDVSSCRAARSGRSWCARSEDEVMVSVVVRDGHTLSEAGLTEHCKANMAYFMVPRFIEFVASLPRTMTEKVEKFKLRADAEGRLSTLWDREKSGIVVGR